jgi:hypothetical protein
MGHYHPLPGTETNPESTEDITISMLINSAHYFIQCVFILKAKNKYRLVVLHNGKVLADSYYNTVRGCKIAFIKRFKEKAWSEEIKAQWSHFYDPDKPWLEKKCKYLES